MELFWHHQSHILLLWQQRSHSSLSHRRRWKVSGQPNLLSLPLSYPITLFLALKSVWVPFKVREVRLPSAHSEPSLAPLTLYWSGPTIRPCCTPLPNTQPCMIFCQDYTYSTVSSPCLDHWDWFCSKIDVIRPIELNYLYISVSDTFKRTSAVSHRQDKM